MPRKQTTTRKTEKNTEAVAEAVPEKTIVPAKKPVAKRATKKPVVEAPPPEEVNDDVEEEVVSDVETEVGTEGTVETKKRRIPTRETVLESFDELVELVEAEITHLRESQSKAKGVKFLRTVNKRIKSLRSQMTRVMKQRQKTNRKNNNNSGFLKPVQISKEMAKFTGWDVTELRSRVDVTKHLCDYIKENDLQNPEDRRQILVDAKLGKLLSYDAKKDDKPLTYYRLQTYLKSHFQKPEVVA